jgi:CBS domain-containing protein
MNAADVMTQKVITVQEEDTLSHAVQVMLQNRISGLPVIDQSGALIGILTEGDLLRRAETNTQRRRPRWLEFLISPNKLAGEYVHAHSRRVKEVMTTKVVSATPSTPLEEVVGLMERHRIKRLPILENGRLIGIISRANLLQLLSVVANEFPQSSASDEDIRNQLWNEINKANWGSGSMLNIVVRDGAVHLYGIVTNSREYDALRIAAENIPGVRFVHSHLTWCDPTTGNVIEMPEDKVAAPGHT